MKKRNLMRALCLVLCLCTLLPCVTVPAFAEESTSTVSERPAVATADPNPTVFPEAEDTVWGFDFAAMDGTLVSEYTSDIGGTFTLSSSNFELTADGYSLAEGKSNGVIRFREPKTEEITSAEKTEATGNSFLAGYDEGVLLLTVVVNFDALPTVTASAPNENILSFITWEYKRYTSVGATSTSTQYSRLLCLDENGYLYNNDRQLMSDTHKLVAGEDAEISIVLDPEGTTCQYDLYLNGTYVFSSSVPISKGISGIVESNVRLFDTRRQYDATLKKVTLETVDKDYAFGKILTADWEGYQTSEVTKDAEGNETFDVRLISLVGTMDGYTEMGYEVTPAYRKNGVAVVEDAIVLRDFTLYTQINQTVNGQTVTWSATENGGEYILATTFEDIDASLIGYELRVRPYAKREDGLKVYGKSQYLIYDGLGTDGRPHFSCSDSSATQTVVVAEDTYVRFGSYENQDFYDATTLQYKWNVTNTDVSKATASPNTRFTFLRFDISELSAGWANYYLSLTYSGCMTDFTTEIYELEDEVLEDGTLAGLTGAKVKNDPDLYLSVEDDPVASFASGNARVDITDYIRAAKAAGKDELIWRVEYKRSDVVAYNNTNHAVATLYSKEDGSRAPAIIGAGYFNYETNLDTYQNSGYEPWGYAELVVDDWYDNIWDIYARDYGYSIMNGTEDTDSKAYVAGDYSVELDVQSGSSFKTIAARTTETIVNYDALYEKPDYDEYGGLAADGGKYYDDPAYSAKVNGTKGYFGTYYDETNNRWWLITPEGNRYIALGICTVTTGSTTGQKTLAQTTYAGKDGSEWTSELLNKIGINTSTGSSISTAARAEGNYIVSTHSGVGLIGSYGSNIGVNASVGGSTVFSNNNTLNVFDPDFVSYAYDKAAKSIGTKSQDVYMLGWTSDNEIPANTDMLIRYLTLDPTVDETVVDDPATKDNEKDVEALNSRNAYSYAVAWTWLRKMTGLSNPTLEEAGNGSALIQMGGESKEVSYLELFRGFVYYRYYSIASDAVKTAAPNQLYLGCRELGGNYQCETVMRVAGIFCDVVTLNLYLGANPSATVIDNIHKWACKPAYVTEFYSKSAGVDDAGNQSGTQSYSIWEVSYPSLVSPTANTYYTVDSITTSVSGGTAKDTYYADGTALWSVEYTASDATAGTQSVEISAYIAKSDTTASVFYLADGETTYRDADGTVKTVPEIILTNNRGAGKVVRSQDDRGVYYETFALKMLESGFCVGWSWYRYQDNDMPLFEDANGNLVYFNDWDAYCDWEEGDGSGLTLIHKGENTDQSNLDANKGIVNNAMEEYTEFTSHITAIANNIYGLAEHFDGRRN